MGSIARRTVDIELGGVRLKLRFEAYELGELKPITGMEALSFLASIRPRDGETPEQAGARCADLSVVIPLIMAGLARQPEYDGLTHKQLRIKLSDLIEREAELQKQSIYVVAANVAAKVLTVVSQSALPPGQSLDDAASEQEGSPPSPLPEGSTSPGDD